MADEKSPSSKKPGSGSSSEGQRVPVLVEMRVAKDQSATQTMAMVSGAMNVSGFQLDQSYEPVSVGPPSEQAAQFEAEHQDVVVVRGTIEETKIQELREQSNVVEVYSDAPIDPFSVTTTQEQDFVEAPSSEGFGPCPIPPCDCEPRIPKGTIADVANYLRVDQIWDKGIKGKGIVVGVVDSGVEAVGRVVGGAIKNVIGGWPTNSWGKVSHWGKHGNMSATDVLGMAPQAKLYDIRIAAGAPQATISAALKGYEWAINQHKANGTPHILTNSWGMWQKAWAEDYATKANHPFTKMVVKALDEGILVLYAAGNCGEACGGSKCAADKGPGKSIWGANGHPRVMTVGAANTKGQYIGYSSQGPAALDPNKPDFCSISHFTGYFRSDSGTSAACPIAAGVVALLKQCKPSLTQEAAKAALKGTAKNIGPAGWDKHSGSGIIQAKAAYNLVCGESKKPSCQKLLATAKILWYRYLRTQKRRYLCQYYRYISFYYRCRYQKDKDPRFLCRYYRLVSQWYRCRYQETKKRNYLCEYYRYVALHYQCLYKVTKKRPYLCQFYRSAMEYFRCRYSITKNRGDLSRAKQYHQRYLRCKQS